MKFNSLIPELSVMDLEKSLKFYVDVLGFKKEYDRPEDNFCFLSIEGSQLMLEELSQGANSGWQTGVLELPFGRGINFQIELGDISPLLQRLSEYKYDLFRELSTEWYRVQDGFEGIKQFLVQDPDGYLLRFCQPIGY
jgi:catechol 2,3-dioxygenase-like lactoylglutathione lyase family enzyme